MAAVFPIFIFNSRGATKVEQAMAKPLYRCPLFPIPLSRRDWQRVRDGAVAGLSSASSVVWRKQMETSSPLIFLKP